MYHFVSYNLFPLVYSETLLPVFNSCKGTTVETLITCMIKTLRSDLCEELMVGSTNLDYLILSSICASTLGSVLGWELYFLPPACSLCTSLSSLMQ